jgi:hypothetical protein
MAAGAVLLTRGMENYLHDATARRLIALIALLGIVFWIVDSILTKRTKARGESVLDERDQVIVHRATHWTLVGVLVYIFVGGIVLTEIFYDEGRVPVSYVFLGALSVLLVSLIVQAAATLFAYWSNADRVEI